MATAFFALPALAANGPGTPVDVSTLGAEKTIVVEGNGSGLYEPYVLIEVANDAAGVKWSTLTMFQRPGEKTVAVACRWMRATVKNYNTRVNPGAPTVNVGGEDDGTTFATLVAPAGNGDGVGVDVSALPAFKTIQVTGLFKGSLNVEVSNDGGATYSLATAFQPNQNGIRSTTLIADFLRVSRSGIAIGDPNAGLPVITIGAATVRGGGSIWSLLDVFPVDVYGARGNGVTDDRAAIVSAMAAAAANGGGTVLFSATKTYLVGKDLVNPWCLDIPASNIRFTGPAGVGAARPVVKMAPGMPATSTLLFRANGVDDIAFSDIILDGNWGAVVGVTTTQAGINQGTQVDPKNHLVMLRGASRVRFANVLFTQSYGDGVWCGTNANDDLDDFTTDVDIVGCEFDISARNGLSMGGPAHRIFVQRSTFSNIYTTCIDAEPQGLINGVRDVVVERNFFDGWWNGQGNNLLISVVGGYPSGYNQSSAARGWRIERNYLHGSMNCFAVIDCIISENRFMVDFTDASSAIAPIFVDHWCDGITIENNYVYDNMVKSVASGDPHNGSIQVQLYGSGTINLQPAGVRVINNEVHARQGVNGVWLNAQGGFTIGDGTPVVNPYAGVATAVTVDTLTDGGAAWTVNQWAGWHVVMDGRVAVIDSNTADTLTLQPAFPALYPSAWFTPTGDQSTTPALAAYVITSTSGSCDVIGNHIDCGADGNLAGGIGIYLFCDRAGSVIRCNQNTIIDAMTWGIIHVGANTKPILSLELIGNQFIDDQGAGATLAAGIRFQSNVATDIGKLTMAQNAIVRGGAALTSFNAAAGQWWVSDGPAAVMQGWGAPVFAVPDGSMYQRLDGAALTTLYARVAGAWVGYA